MSALTASRWRPTWTRGALALAAMVAACGGDEGGSRAVASISTPACPRLADVVRLFGATMRGGAPAPLGAFFAVEGGRTTIRPPPGATDFCSTSMAGQLDNACAQSSTSGWCGFDSTLESCLVAVEGVFYDPSVCGICGDGRCGPDDCDEDCACGDGVCDLFTEDIWRCPQDCLPAVACGNGACEGYPTTWQPEWVDTPVVTPYEICGACEDQATNWPGCVSCAADCCRGACGDGACIPELGETRATCEQDCTWGVCGDHICIGRENPGNCATDCDTGTPVDESFAAWSAHCLNPGCSHPEAGFTPCRDERQACGDGICMGCEVWTCGADCQGTSFLHCPAHDDTCPPGSCGDGSCDGTVESARTCPLDCPPEDLAWSLCDDGVCTPMHALVCPWVCADDPEGAAAWCGDGLCDTFETDASCPADCLPRAASCPALSTCAADGRRCAQTSVRGPVTGVEATRWAILGCSGDCEVVEVCADVCVQDAAGARCVDCGWQTPHADTRCVGEPVPHCVDAATLSWCEPDPSAPDEPACARRRLRSCDAGCVDGRCRPCDDSVVCAPLDHCVDGACVARTTCGDGFCGAGERATCAVDCGTCGDGRCQEGESESSCPQDCECPAGCLIPGAPSYEDEVRCPETFAACHCGLAGCQAWEREGAWECPEDCEQ